MGLISSADTEDFNTLFSTLAHRGPDASRVLEIGHGPWRAKLGHHRLSIIDVEGGSQPMSSGAHTIVFNGEIYNYERLRAELDVQWRTRSDTEVVLEFVRAFGPGALARLDGFFAFGVFDQDRGELLLARDRWGIKPLYYAPLPDGGLLFASELHPFLHSRAVSRSAPIGAVSDYLFWDHVPYDRTILAGVYKLEPGQFLSWRDGRTETGRYYEPRDLLRAPRRKTTPGEVWESIRESVRGALIADVPVGVLLSGGIDSSLIALAAREVLGRGFPTFAIGFKDGDFDESAHARKVAERLGAEHHERILDEGDLLERWRDIASSLDEPIADPSIIPTRLLCELARRHVPVALGGDGGDELFGGYPTYRAQRLRRWLDLIPPPVFSGLRSLVQGLRSRDGYQPLTWKLKRLVGRYDAEPLVGHFRWMSGTDLTELDALTGRRLRPVLREAGDVDPHDLQTYLYLDLRHYLPYTVLTKVDRASMAIGLECRPPFLANDCVTQAFRIPSGQKVSTAGTKLILREVARELALPPEISDRPKRGFAIPLARWLKGPLAADIDKLLADSPLWAPGALRPEAARELWGQFLSGRGDHAKTFWSLLVLHTWSVRQGVSIGTGG